MGAPVCSYEAACGFLGLRPLLPFLVTRPERVVEVLPRATGRPELV